MLRYDRPTNPGLVAFYDIRPETERVYSYNPGALYAILSCISETTTTFRIHCAPTCSVKEQE